MQKTVHNIAFVAHDLINNLNTETKADTVLYFSVPRQSRQKRGKKERFYRRWFAKGIVTFLTIMALGKYLKGGLRATGELFTRAMTLDCDHNSNG